MLYGKNGTSEIFKDAEEVWKFEKIHDIPQKIGHVRDSEVPGNPGKTYFPRKTRHPKLSECTFVVSCDIRSIISATFKRI